MPLWGSMLSSKLWQAIDREAAAMMSPVAFSCKGHGSQVRQSLEAGRSFCDGLTAALHRRLSNVLDRGSSFCDPQDAPGDV